MLDGEDLTGFGEVEHVEDDGLGASVLASMDRADDLYQRFALMERALIAVLADDGQVSLLHMVMRIMLVDRPDAVGNKVRVHPRRYAQTQKRYDPIAQIHSIRFFSAKVLLFFELCKSLTLFLQNISRAPGRKPSHLEIKRG